MDKDRQPASPGGRSAWRSWQRTVVEIDEQHARGRVESLAETASTKTSGRRGNPSAWNGVLLAAIVGYNGNKLSPLEWPAQTHGRLHYSWICPKSVLPAMQTGGVLLH